MSTGCCTSVGKWNSNKKVYKKISKINNGQKCQRDISPKVYSGHPASEEMLNCTNHYRKQITDFLKGEIWAEDSGVLETFIPSKRKLWL